jgi:hypothetical protein
VRLDGGVAKLTALQSWQPEVSYWGNIQELREVLEIADDGRLTLTPREFETPERVNDVYHRLQKLAGRGKSGDHAVSAWPGAEDQFSAGSTAAGSTSSR